MDSLLGWMLIAGAAAPFWYTRRALLRGSVEIGDQVSKRIYLREESPGAFWFGVGFYVLLGFAMIVLGALELAGLLG